MVVGEAQSESVTLRSKQGRCVYCVNASSTVTPWYASAPTNLDEPFGVSAMEKRPISDAFRGYKIMRFHNVPGQFGTNDQCVDNR